MDVIINVGDKVTTYNPSVKGKVIRISGAGRNTQYTVNWNIDGESVHLKKHIFLDKTANIAPQLSDEESEEDRDEEDSSSSEESDNGNESEDREDVEEAEMGAAMVTGEDEEEQMYVLFYSIYIIT
jgi:hypothetical protein